MKLALPALVAAAAAICGCFSAGVEDLPEGPSYSLYERTFDLDMVYSELAVAGHSMGTNCLAVPGTQVKEARIIASWEPQSAAMERLDLGMILWESGDEVFARYQESSPIDVALSSLAADSDDHFLLRLGAADVGAAVHQSATITIALTWVDPGREPAVSGCTYS